MSKAEWKSRKDRIDKRLHSLSPPSKILRFQPDLDLSALEGLALEELATAIN